MSIKKLTKQLNLIYYEYDKNSNFSNKDAVYEELIKITHLLSKEGIKFFVDENSSIVLNGTDSIFLKMKRYINSFIQNI